MKRRLALLLIWVIVLTVIVPVAGLAEVSVGVKEGDWMEYEIEYTGSPPEGYPSWLRVDVISVQGTSIDVLATRELVNGTTGSHSVTVDLETGVPDLVLIPANLDDGDEFYHEVVGNITIIDVQDATYAGAKRTILLAPVTQVLYRWDRATGVLLEATQSSTGFTQHLLLDKTNMWGPQSSELPFDSTVFYTLILVAVVVVAVVVFVVLRRRKKSVCSYVFGLLKGLLLGDRNIKNWCSS